MQRVLEANKARASYRALAWLACLALPASALAASAQVTTIHSFGETPGSGEQPQVALTLGSDGYLYGTTDLGGAFFHGTIFRTTTAGAVTVLYSFGATGDSDGFFPRSPLMQASDGAFYGTTDVGGGAGGGGTVFRISSLGVFSTLHRFNETGDGNGPHGRLVQGGDGFLYGTTIGGGPCTDGGTLYRLSLAGAYSLLYSFGCADVDGGWPIAGLTALSNGSFLGSTFFSGPWNGPFAARGGGTVFRFSPGSGVTTFFDFHKEGCDEDGAAPEAAMIVGSNGALYGTTVDGGKYGRGAIFRMTPQGEETVLYSFGSVPNDGLEPSGSLLQLANGALVGTTRFGGANDDDDSWGGTLFMLKPDGTYTLLHSFCGALPDGCAPWEGGLTLGPDGAIYGTTEFGGSQDAGTVFKLVIDSAGTAPTFISAPASCAVSSAVSTHDDAGGAFPLSIVVGMMLVVLARTKILCRLVGGVLLVLAIPSAGADLRSELEAMFDSDQSHRITIQQAAMKSNIKSPEFVALLKKQQSIDAANLKRLKEIVSTIGWPKHSAVGEKAAFAAFLIVQHADQATQKEYLPLLKAAVAEGEALPENLALLEDRVLMREGKKQRYGSQLQQNAAGQWEFYPIEDETKVDKRRKAVGLPPIAEYAKQMGLTYPK